MAPDPRLACVGVAADGMVHKGAQAGDVLQAIHSVAAGESRFAPLLPEFSGDAAAAIGEDDRPLFRVLIERLPRDEIASRLGLSAAEPDARSGRILARLSVPVPRAAAGPGALGLAPPGMSRGSL